ncbi:hypothetical protein IAU60_005658 [Kwoniella sp. DSM 27419]
MPPLARVQLQPNDVKAFSHPSVRRRWIQNLVNALHACLLRGDSVRANRAWAILVRCREVDWRSKWHWGLLLLSLKHDPSPAATSYQATQASMYSQDTGSRDIERWLNALRVAAKEEDKPSLLHALVLYLIKQGQYRQAYDQLETYLPSYPYLLSGPLHTYAGMIAFYLAQPPSLRADVTEQAPRDGSDDWETRSASVPLSPTQAGSQSSASPPPALESQAQVDSFGIRTARTYFSKALGINSRDDVASSFIKLIDNPTDARVESDDDKSDESMCAYSSQEEDGKDDDEEFDSKSDSEMSSDDGTDDMEKLEMMSEQDGYASF